MNPPTDRKAEETSCWSYSLPRVAALALGTINQPTTPVETLRLVLRLLEVPERWTQDDWARDSAGYPLLAIDRDACCWCLTGALNLVTCQHYDQAKPFHENTLYWTTYNILKRTAYTDSLPDWQDTHSHAEVIAMLCKALEYAETI